MKIIRKSALKRYIDSCVRKEILKRRKDAPAFVNKIKEKVSNVKGNAAHNRAVFSAWEPVSRLFKETDKVEMEIDDAIDQTDPEMLKRAILHGKQLLSQMEKQIPALKKAGQAVDLF